MVISCNVRTFYEYLCLQSSSAADPEGDSEMPRSQLTPSLCLKHTHTYTDTQMWVRAVAQLKCQHVPYYIDFSDRQ